MAIVNLLGSLVMTNLDAAVQTLPDVGLNGGRVRCAIDKVEVGAADSDTSTYRVARLPSNARILPGSKLMRDDLASAGAPTLDVGIQSVTNKTDITADPDALTNGIDAATAGEADLVADIADWGKQLWEYGGGVAADPKTLLDVYVSLVDADVNVGGTITVVIFYTVD